MPESPSLIVRGGDVEVRGAPGERHAPTRVRGGGGLVVEARALLPGSAAHLALGEDERELSVPADGVVRWAASEWLVAAAGRLRVALRGIAEDGGPATIDLDLLVEPTKLAAESLAALIADLEAVAAGLASDLGGRTVVAGSGETPERVLQRLEEVVGSVAAAASWIRRRPAVRRRERVTAVQALQPRLSARDVRWLAHHPAESLRVGAGGGALAVAREVHDDLDIAENRGALWLFDRLETLADEVLRRLDHESEAIEAGRAAREAFVTEHATLFEEQDEPRLRAVQRRRERVTAIHAELIAARTRAALPAALPRTPLRRTARVESHPGYWGLYRANERLAGIELDVQRRAFAPLASLDELYETWCVVRVVAALAELAGQPLRDLLRVSADRWFTRLPDGEVARLSWGDRVVRVLRAPSYAWQGDGPLVKLHPGRPWIPDVAVEVLVSDWPVGLHLFDAKHRIDPARPDRIPMDALQDVWFKYPDSIGRREDSLPAVDSAWILFPGPTPILHLRSPRMLDPSWPTDRVRGGALALRPGDATGEIELKRVLAVLLGVRRAA